MSFFVAAAAAAAATTALRHKKDKTGNTGSTRLNQLRPIQLSGVEGNQGGIAYKERRVKASFTLKYDKRFTQWHAIRRANEGRTHYSVRGDAWRCGSDEVVRAMPWRKF